MTTLDVSALAAFGIAATPGAYPCRGRACSATVELPGICAACGDRLARADHERSLAKARSSIPERFRWATIESLPAHPGRVKMPQRLLDAAARLTRHRVLMLVGPSGNGKTSVACAVLRAAIDAGGFEAPRAAQDRAQRARYYEARKLFTDAEEREDGQPPYVLAMHMPVVVLDDVGQEVGGAIGNFKAAERSKMIGDILSARHEDSRLTTIVTTFARRNEWARLYGDGVARRYFDAEDGVKVVDFEKLGGGT